MTNYLFAKGYPPSHPVGSLVVLTEDGRKMWNEDRYGVYLVESVSTNAIGDDMTKEPWDFQSTQFMGCCGVTEVFGFPDLYEMYGTYYPKKGARSKLDLISSLEDVAMNCESLIVITLTDRHQKHCLRSIKALGFKKAISFFNHNSDNDVSLYFAKRDTVMSRAQALRLKKKKERK